MKRLLLLLVLCAPFAHGAISEVTSAECKAASTTCTAGATLAGDLWVAHTWDTSAATSPTLATGWTNIANSTGNTVGERFACKVATGSGDTFGTWTNATLVILLVYRGTAAGRTENCNFTMARVGAAGGASSATISYTTFTLFDRTGTSWVEGCAAHRTASNLTAPTGMTLQQSIGAGPMAVCSNTQGGVSSWSTTTTGVNATSGWRSETIEILAPCGTAPCFDVYIDGEGAAAGTAVSTTNLASSTFFGLSTLSGTPWSIGGTGAITLAAHTAGVRELGGNFTASDGTTIVGPSHASQPIRFDNSTASTTVEPNVPTGTYHLIMAAGWITIGASATSATPALWDMVRHETLVTGHFSILQFSQATNKCTPNAGIDNETDPSGTTHNGTCFQFASTPQTFWYNIYYDSTGTASTAVSKIALYDTCANGGGLLFNDTEPAGAETGAGAGITDTEFGNAEFGVSAGTFNFFENTFLFLDRNALSFPVGPNCSSPSGNPAARQHTGWMM